MLHWLENLDIAMLENLLEKPDSETRLSYFEFAENPRELLEKITDLSPLKSTVQKALSLFEDEDPNTASLISLVKNDPCLCARVLKVANSCLFLKERLVANVHEAAMTLGYKNLKTVILSACLVNRDRESSEEENDVAEFSLSVAKTAYFLAQQLKKKYQDETYILGLLHNLADFLRLQKQIPQTESLKLIGSLVARKWNLPEDICIVLMRYQGSLKETYKNPIEEQGALVHLACEIVKGSCNEKQLREAIENLGERKERATYLAREILGYCDL